MLHIFLCRYETLTNVDLNDILTAVLQPLM